MKLLKLLYQFYKDQRGQIDPLTASAIGLSALSSIGGIFGGRKKQKTEIYDPYARQRSQLSSYLSGKLGTSTPYTYNPAFATAQPEVEAETEKGILQGLRNLPAKRADIQAIYGRYGEARKAAARDRQAEEAEDLKDMYNRLGLVSSTPGLTAQTELGRKHGLDLDVIESEIAAGGVGAEMEAEKLYQDIANQYMTQGQLLGGRQRGYKSEAIGRSMEDITRTTGEEQDWARLLQGLIGQPTYVSTTGQNTASQLGSAGMDIGTLLLLASLGKK